MQSEKKNRVIRPLRLDDLPEIIAIERICFPDAWSAESFRGVLQNKLFYCCGLFENRLEGYLISMIAAGELHILNIAVRPESRRRGIAEEIYFQTFRKYEKKIALAYLEVRTTNFPAIAFYQKLGFQEAGIRRRYYPDGEDAILMTLVVG